MILCLCQEAVAPLLVPEKIIIDIYILKVLLIKKRVQEKQLHSVNLKALQGCKGARDTGPMYLTGVI